MPLVTAILAVVVVAVSQAAGRWSLAVYVLSFWHYVAYALAYFRRQIPLERFKRDAVLLKTMSLAALALALLATVPSPLALAVMAAGFALNIAAARSLGSDRTYYGVEVAGLPPERSTAFPYSVMSHPMIIGNLVAYGGTLLDAEFRQSWWPLALLHMLANLLLVVMELRGGESRLLGTLWPCTGLALGSALLLIGFMDVWQFALATIVIGLAFAAFLFCRYGKAMDQEKLREKPS